MERSSNAPGWPGPSDGSRPSQEQSLAAALASIASVLEVIARIQDETAEVLRDLAARTGNEAIIHRLSSAEDLHQQLEPVRSALTAQERSPRRDGQGQPHRLAAPLTPREQVILRMLTSRLSLPEISRERDVSLNTVKSQTRAIYQKLGVSSRREAVQRGHDYGLIPHFQSSPSAGLVHDRRHDAPAADRYLSRHCRPCQPAAAGATA